MLQLISATGQQTVDALAFLLAFALTALMDSVFHDKLPHDHGRAFAVNGELSKGKARGSGLIFVLCIALVTLAVVPFKVEYLIYTVLLIASMLSGYFDDASETAWNEYKKGLIDFVIAVVAGVTYLIRMLPLTLIRKEIKSTYIKSFLYYVPYVTLAAMTFPAILSATANIWSALAGFIIAVFLAYRGKSLLKVSLFACLGVFIVELITGL